MMPYQRGTRGRSNHPDDLALEQLAEGQREDQDAAAQAHVAGCPRCRGRVAELQRIRSLVREAALREERPGRDLAGSALARLRARRRAGEHVNEVLAGLSTFLRSLAVLFARAKDERTPQDHRNLPTPREEEDHE